MTDFCYTYSFRRRKGCYQGTTPNIVPSGRPQRILSKDCRMRWTSVCNRRPRQVLRRQRLSRKQLLLDQSTCRQWRRQKRSRKRQRNSFDCCCSRSSQGIFVLHQLLSIYSPLLLKAIPSVAEIGCGAIAALCLRMPDNASTFVANGAAQLLVDILKTHKLKVSVEVPHLNF